jgi:uncharacterized membrane protein
VHLHLPHLPVPAVLLSAVYAAAIAVAIMHPGQPTLAGLVVLAGLAARWVARHRRAVPVPVAVLTPDAASAPATSPAVAA